MGNLILICFVALLLASIGALALYLAARLAGNRFGYTKCFIPALAGVATFFLIVKLYSYFYYRPSLDGTPEEFEFLRNSLFFGFAVGQPIYYMAILRSLSLTTLKTLIVQILSFTLLAPVMLLMYLLYEYRG